MFSSWNQIKEAPARLGTRTRDTLGRARTAGRARWVRVRSGAARIGTRALRVTAVRSDTVLKAADSWVGRAERWPALGRLAGAAGRLVDQGRERLAVLPVTGWDGLVAREAIKALSGLDAVGLRVTRAREVAGKNRVTVVHAIDDALGKQGAVATAA